MCVCHCSRVQICQFELYHNDDVGAEISEDGRDQLLVDREVVPR